MESDDDAVVAVRTEKLERSARGSIVGPIWISSPKTGAAFPELAWSDSPVALLAGWIPALQRLARRGEAAECHFMDGPYHFTISAAGADRWRIACFEDREAQVRVGHAVIELDTTPARFLESAASAGRAVLGYCDTRGWWTDDTERLRAALDGGV